VAPVISDAVGPVSGGDRVAADLVTDLTLTYAFSRGQLKGSQAYVNVNNLFDRDPPFYNGATPRGPTLAGSTNGYNGWVSNPLGRVVSLGFRGKF
jgi:iron complex outermembrane receptor protein